jgi:pSer/pThr/pTyr-binding forkhead associated (FHA) protein
MDLRPDGLPEGSSPLPPTGVGHSTSKFRPSEPKALPPVDRAGARKSKPAPNSAPPQIVEPTASVVEEIDRLYAEMHPPVVDQQMHAPVADQKAPPSEPLKRSSVPIALPAETVKRSSIPVAPPAEPLKRLSTPAAPVTSLRERSRTIESRGLPVDKLITNKQFALQIFGDDGKWHRFQAFDRNGIKIGRGERIDRVPAFRTVALRHFRLTPEGSKMKLEDLGSLNGVFRRITGPHPLSDGMRFRVGQYLIEFRLAKPKEEVRACVKDGEEFSCIDPVAPALLVFIRPDGNDGLSFPITKTETLLGQERPDESAWVDIHLPADLTSGRHAKIARTDTGFVLENLSRTIGTFVKIQGDELIRPGDEFLAGQVMFRVALDND